MSGQLRTFTPAEIMITANDAATIINWLWPGSGMSSTSMTSPQIGFAQALLVEAIDASYAMGFVESLFRSLSPPPASVQTLVTRFARNAARHWFRHARQQDLMNARIYESVRVTLARNFRSEWEMQRMGL